MDFFSKVFFPQKTFPLTQQLQVIKDGVKYYWTTSIFFYFTATWRGFDQDADFKKLISYIFESLIFAGILIQWWVQTLVS